MLKVGITGGIGSGKSFVSKILKSFGYPVFSSDTAAKEIISTNPQVKEQLISFFGESTFKNNQLDRVFLAKIIFNDDEALQKVNKLIHPLVRMSFEEFSHQQKSPIVFNEAAILFESGGASQFDKIILVSAPKELKIQRVMKRDGVSENEVLERMNKQWPDKDKAKLSDFIILNDGKTPLLTQIKQVIDTLKS